MPDIYKLLSSGGLDFLSIVFITGNLIPWGMSFTLMTSRKWSSEDDGKLPSAALFLCDPGRTGGMLPVSPVHCLPSLTLPIPQGCLGFIQRHRLLDLPVM